MIQVKKTANQILTNKRLFKKLFKNWLVPIIRPNLKITRKIRSESRFLSVHHFTLPVCQCCRCMYLSNSNWSLTKIDDMCMCMYSCLKINILLQICFIVIISITITIYHKKKIFNLNKAVSFLEIKEKQVNIIENQHKKISAAKTVWKSE